MFNWFKRNQKPDPDILKEQIDEATQQYIAILNQIAYMNGLSTAQTASAFSKNKDIDFYEDELIEMMNDPDIHNIIKMVVDPMPQDFINATRKNINPKDIIIGSIIGDIIGSKYEFTPHNYDLVELENIPKKKSFFTDDTVLSIATVKAVLENKKNPDFRKAYLEAYRDKPRAGFGASFVDWALGEIDNTRGYNSYGNGCAMRIAFIPAYYEDFYEMLRHAANSVMVTHNHVESVKNTLILAICIWMALHNATKEDIAAYCNQHFYYTEEERKLLYCGITQYDWIIPLHQLPNNESRASLFVNYAVPFAIKCFLETDSYEECMREILRHYGDTDTICAIAGGLCVAYYGTTGLDDEKILKDAQVSEI